MTDSDEIVREFCGLWATMDVERMIDFFAEDAVYHNIPMEPAVGREAIAMLINGWAAVIEGIDFDIHHQVSVGGVVMNERTDTLRVNGTLVPLPVMGTFEIVDGKIRAWRDYFDMREMTKAFQAGAA
ncbi:limonene-1,2-epoxide hydrolase family protein [Mycobacteroides abscessus]|uniref:limonene-1,2-epoxide hydrolase family protein n=1 Tax=Mycobacteroides abscessus TaxID=36809 RepID=UPI0009A74A11|nr:limonene-1,2-epoxide hydrolase family protein [Mycobacteroides abscessus]SKF63201.1 limonene-1,2-epoxide hydrolase [Mycobacteroides abscessus subsp. bolletii]SKF75830.1 limonene-1,2-epoxide hydrolase [Mycobacteroides abscessus subsp. bolletii]SKG37010.1 limonene-1,2-epoxide hydrolase [Mycobacteroides abscessus subsp. bolletii]SKG55844.1 limonene-1,2-epoxide hydrolase [Mycobacteroides abscessus subsp. bolletii]SKG71051.1 limonene-1,2-epoxide hydrolase [Mycobacteroides abscessus subsp. bollet